MLHGCKSRKCASFDLDYGYGKNNAYFNLQHSTDGIHFTTLDKIYSQAENGNSNVQLTYNFIHHQPTLGHNYYRLEQVDIDGQSTIESKIIDMVMNENY